MTSTFVTAVSHPIIPSLARLWDVEIKVNEFVTYVNGLTKKQYRTLARAERTIQQLHKAEYENYD